MSQSLSTIPPPPSSHTTVALILDGWILLRRPSDLTPEDFSQALSDLTALGKLSHRIIDGNVYVRWIQ